MVEENISFFIDDSIEQENSDIDFDLDFDLNQILNMEYIFKDEDNFQNEN